MNANHLTPKQKAALNFHTRTCKECGIELTGKGPRQVFCSTAHKNAFHNRSMKEGKTLVPLLKAWRAGRGSDELSKLAFKDLMALVDRLNAEDKDEGRPSAREYVAAKFYLGHDDQH